MSQIQRFLLLLVLLVLATTLIFAFNSNHKPKPRPRSLMPSPVESPSPTLPPPAQRWNNYETKDITIEEKPYHLLVADTLEKQELGLMNVTTLDGYDGMVFLFPDTSIKSFWNKNTLIDLQIYWMNNDIVMGTEILPSINKTGGVKVITSPGAVNTVVELVQK